MRININQSKKLQQFTKLYKGEGRFIVSFVPKFVAMATGVSRGEI